MKVLRRTKQKAVLHVQKLQANGDHDLAISATEVLFRQKKLTQTEYLLLRNFSLVELGRFTEAEDTLSQIARDESIPSHFRVNALTQLGLIARKLGKEQESELMYQEVLRLEPDNSVGTYNLALFQLIRKNFDHGFRFYEARIDQPEQFRGIGGGRLPSSQIKPMEFLVVLGEQGIGDQLFFLKFLSSLIERTQYTAVYVVIDKRLVSLFKSSTRLIFLDIATLNELNLPKSEVCFVALGSLPKILIGLNFDLSKMLEEGELDVPSDWLADVSIDHRAKNRVAISWGSPAGCAPSAKSVSLEELLRMIPCELECVSVQYSSDEDDERVIKLDVNLTNDLSSVTEILKSSSCLVSVSTAVVHLAALHKCPVWLLVPESGVGKLWYWYHVTNDNRSVWYPSVRVATFARTDDTITVQPPLNLVTNDE